MAQSIRLLGWILCIGTLPVWGQVITTVAGTTWTFRESGAASSTPVGLIQSIAVDSAGNVFAADFGSQLVLKMSKADGAVTIVAGNGIDGFSGDGGPGPSAALSSPRGVAVDPAGNIFIAEESNQRVRKIGTDGTIVTVAGNGNAGFSGDGDLAVNASLNSPYGLVLDAAGNLYIADQGNHRIRKITTDGKITTVAGNGSGSYSGDGGAAINASLNMPTGLAIDREGALYIADMGNHRIRKVNRGGIISTVAGNGTAAFGGDGGPAFNAPVNSPQGVSVDGGGNIYIADTSNNRIRKVTSGGLIATIAGTGVAAFSGDGEAAVRAALNMPSGVAADGNGNVYIADQANRRIRKLGPDGKISTSASDRGLFKFGGDNGPANEASLNSPAGMAFDADGNLYLADQAGHRIRKIEAATGKITTVAGNGISGFSGDGGAASKASLSSPSAVAVDGGSLYVADTGNHRIRKVDSSGVITTIAGNGTPGFSGDGGPPASASLNSPQGLAIESNGGLYIADTGNNRIRKIPRGLVSGIITTAAGNGSAGFAGDGGTASTATLNGPMGIALDSSGNLFIADTANSRIRRVNTSGIITTVAGTGAYEYSGDGGSASSAALKFPSGVAVDTARNLYIADSSNHRVRKVDSGGTITTIAGTGQARFAGDGGLAAEAAVNTPLAVLVDAKRDLYISDSGNDRIRKVLLVTSPAFALAPSALTFSATSGVGTVVPQEVTLSSPVNGLAWSVEASTDSGGAWLDVSPNSGTAPQAVTVAVNASQLPAGTYQGNLKFLVPLASPATQIVPVTFTVGPAPPARISVQTAAVVFELPAGSESTVAQTLRVVNSGTSLLDWTATATTLSGGNWLSVSPTKGSASATSPRILQVMAKLSGLAAGVYSGVVRVENSSSGEGQSVPVSLVLSDNTPSVFMSHRGLLFNAIEKGSAVPAQGLGIVTNSGTGVNWSVDTSTVAGGEWLTVAPGSGSANISSPAELSVAVDPRGLKSGTYSGLLRVNTPDASTASQLISVHLNVLPPGSNPRAVVRPTALVFTVRAGSTSMSAQSVYLTKLGTGASNFVARTSGSASDWLDVQPRAGRILGANSSTLAIQPRLRSQTPGVYEGSVSVAFDDGTPAQLIDVLMIVTPPSVDGQVLAPCTPSSLQAVVDTLGKNFIVPAGWPANLEVWVVDNCGNPITNANVTASFSNGDTPLTLLNWRNGKYTGTWRPGTAASQVIVSVTADGDLDNADLALWGEVIENPGTPIILPGGIVGAADPKSGGALPPGGLITIYGRNLAYGRNEAKQNPLETSLGGATLSFGGIDAPLFFSSEGQVNAQLPFEVKPNGRLDAVARLRPQDGGPEIISVPEPIIVRPFRPALVTVNQQGSGQGQIVNVQGKLVDSSAPARGGDVVQLVATGLGATEPSQPSGVPPPPAPLFNVIVPPEVKIGEKVAKVEFAGLAPGFVGLYQVNVRIPDGLEKDPATPLFLSQKGLVSNTVTIAIR